MLLGFVIVTAHLAHALIEKRIGLGKTSNSTLTSPDRCPRFACTAFRRLSERWMGTSHPLASEIAIGGAVFGLVALLPF